MFPLVPGSECYDSRPIKSALRVKKMITASRYNVAAIISPAIICRRDNMSRDNMSRDNIARDNIDRDNMSPSLRQYTSASR